MADHILLSAQSSQLALHEKTPDSVSRPGQEFLSVGGGRTPLIVRAQRLERAFDAPTRRAKRGCLLRKDLVTKDLIGRFCGPEAGQV